MKYQDGRFSQLIVLYILPNERRECNQPNHGLILTILQYVYLQKRGGHAAVDQTHTRSPHVSSCS